jgi:hypothetical protein
VSERRRQWADNDNAMSLGANVRAGCSGSWDGRGDEVRFVGGAESAMSARAEFRTQWFGCSLSRYPRPRPRTWHCGRMPGCASASPLLEQLASVERRPHGRTVEYRCKSSTGQMKFPIAPQQSSTCDQRAICDQRPSAVPQSAFS